MKRAKVQKRGARSAGKKKAARKTVTAKTSDLNKSLTVKFFEQVFNHENYDVVAELLSPDYKFNGVKTSAAQTVGWAKGLHQKFPDLHFVIEAILGEGEKVALRWRMNATAGGEKGYVTGTNILVFAKSQAISNDQGGGADFVPLQPAASTS
jgi:predicted ester cyclase